jgi:hypothetical protein
LKVVERNGCCLSFEGGGEHVTVTAARCEPDHTEVDLEIREWDYQVKKFMGRFNVLWESALVPPFQCFRSNPFGAHGRRTLFPEDIGKTEGFARKISWESSR